MLKCCSEQGFVSTIHMVTDFLQSTGATRKGCINVCYVETTVTGKPIQIWKIHFIKHLSKSELNPNSKPIYTFINITLMKNQNFEAAKKRVLIKYVKVD
jgi:hypothetical protein